MRTHTAVASASYSAALLSTALLVVGCSSGSGAPSSEAPSGPGEPTSVAPANAHDDASPPVVSTPSTTDAAPPVRSVTDAGVDAAGNTDVVTPALTIDAGLDIYADPTCKGLTLDAWPRDSSGWTVLPPVTQSGRRVIYVSASNAGKTSPDPTNASVYYVTTPEAGVALLREGLADSLLFNRGETFNLAASIDSHGLSGGTTMDQAKVVGAYGTGPRPILMWNQAHSIIAVESYAAQNLILTQLDIEPSPSLTEQGTGITLASSSIQSVLVEDVKINGFQKGMDLESGTDFVVRRSEIVNSCGGYRSQGIYIQSVTGITLDENYMDQNGLQTCGDPTSGSPEGQGVYVQSFNACFRAEGNVLTRSLGNTLEARIGGDIEGNVFIGSSTALNYGYTLGGSIEGKTMNRGVYGKVTGNVFLSNHVGVELGNIASVLYANNVMAATVDAALLMDSQNGIGIHGLLISENAISAAKYFMSYQYGLPVGPVVLKHDPSTTQFTDCDGAFGATNASWDGIQVWEYQSTPANMPGCYTGLLMNGGAVYTDATPSVLVIPSTSTGIAMSANDPPVAFTEADAYVNNRVAVTYYPFEEGTTPLKTNPATQMAETGDNLTATFAKPTASIADVLGTEDAYYAAMAAQSHDSWNASITAAAIIPYFQTSYGP